MTGWEQACAINGPGNQAGAAFSFDGRTLYFNAALNSRPGFGRYDLFVTTRSRDTGSHAR